MAKDTSCWLNGMFFFTPLHYEVRGLRLQVEDMSDHDLVDEVMNFWDIEHPIVDDILANFAVNETLNEYEREQLINFYILAEMQDFLIIEDKKEW